MNVLQKMKLFILNLLSEINIQLEDVIKYDMMQLQQDFKIKYLRNVIGKLLWLAKTGFYWIFCAFTCGTEIIYALRVDSFGLIKNNFTFKDHLIAILCFKSFQEITTKILKCQLLSLLFINSIFKVDISNKSTKGFQVDKVLNMKILVIKRGVGFQQNPQRCVF